MKNVRFLYLAKGNIPGSFPSQVEYMLKFKFNGTLEFHRITKDEVWNFLTDSLDKAFHAFATAPTPDPKVIFSHDLKKSAKKTITGNVHYKWKDGKWNLETLEVKWGSKRLVFLDEATSLRFWLDIYLNLRSIVK